MVDCIWLLAKFSSLNLTYPISNYYNSFWPGAPLAKVDCAQPVPVNYISFSVELMFELKETGDIYPFPPIILFLLFEVVPPW